MKIKQQVVNIMLIIPLLIASGCSKDGNNSPTGENQNTIPTFSGYTATDEIGNLFGFVDTTDWTNDHGWVDLEKALFSDYELLYHNILFDTSFKIFPAFPNPCSSIFLLNHHKDSASFFRFRLVNQDFIVLVEADSITSNYMAINLDQVNTGPGPLLRLYYMIVRKQDEVHFCLINFMLGKFTFNTLIESIMYKFRSQSILQYGF